MFYFVIFTFCYFSPLTHLRLVCCKVTFFSVIMAVLLGNNPQLNTDKHYDSLLTTFSEAVKRIFQTTTKLYGIPVNICQKLDLKVWRDFKESVDVSLSLGK